MWLNNKPVLVSIISSLLLLGNHPAGGAEIEITAERQKICAKADQQYDKYYPDASLNAQNALGSGVIVVKLYKYNFCPANITISAGTTVRWVNVDKRTSHSVWLKDAASPDGGPETAPESGRFFPEESWEFSFPSAGEFPYLCGPHWKDEGMRGFVKVVP